MSAVESRLAATLAKHVYNEWGVDDDYCSCGASTSSNGWPAHVAAVIASSDDLAVFWPFSDSTTVRTYPRYREVGWSVHGEPEEPVTPSPWAAREALAPIRELHQWTTDGDADLCSHGCTDHEGYLVWPCDTARLVYTTEELSDGE